MTGRNVKKQRDDAMRLLRKLVVQCDYRPRFGSPADDTITEARSFLRRFAVEEQKKQAHAQRNGVKK